MTRSTIRLVAAAAVLATLVPPGTAAAAPAGAAARPDPAAAGAVRVEPAVVDDLAADGVAEFWVRFHDRADLSRADEIDDWAERGEFVHRTLVENARASQGFLTAALGASEVDFQPFWITNAVLVRGGDRMVLELARIQPGVAEIRAAHTYQLPDPVEVPDPPATAAVEWGIASIGADRVWSETGARGEGIVVGNIDTGVDYTHPALVGQYRGNLGSGSFDHNYSWWDPSGVCGDPSAGPCDNEGHGTHTMGTMLGDDGAGNQVGVAPGARWIAAKGCEDRNCSDAALLSSGQFMLAPTDLNGENPRPDLRPHVVNNSWGKGNFEAENPFYHDILDAWTAAGIFGVFSNGNEGDDRPAPACDTTSSPADDPHAWGVGAYGEDNRIAGFSSRGPGGDGVVKPNIAAPGVEVRSSIPGGGYAASSGTSMAAPHQSGAVALLWSAAPAMIGHVIPTRDLFGETAVDVDDISCGGTPGNNNVWGEGRLDVRAAVQQAPHGPAGTLTGTVTDAAAGAPVAGATVTVTGETTRTTATSADGSYRLLLPAGGYTVRAQAQGYHEQTAPGVEVTDGQTTTRNFALDPAAELRLAPAELTSWQRPDESVAHPLTIGNTGGAALAWDLDPDGSACGSAGSPPWVAVVPGAGLVAPADEQAVEVSFDSTGLTEGELSASICLRTDDPRQAAVEVPLTLVVDTMPPPSWVQRDKLTPSDRTGQVDQFGWQVAADGDTAVVLACNAPGGSAAYVYTRSASGWREQAKLDPSSGVTGCGGFFEGSVALDGDTILIGLPLSVDGTFTGTVTVFARAAGEWTEQAEFAGLGFGFEVALDGDTALTSGANAEVTAPVFHVFTRAGGSWSEQPPLTGPGLPGPAIGGFVIALDGDTALAGQVDFDGGTRPGAAIFTRHGDNWTLQAELAPGDGAAGLDFAQHDVALDGGTAVVTASRQVVGVQSAAYVFAGAGGDWQEQAKLTLPDDSNWRAVAVQGDTVLVGSESADAAYLFNRVGQAWRHHVTLTPADPVAGNRFGRSVGLDGDIAVVSTYPIQLFSRDNGPAYVFDTGAPAPTVGLTPRTAGFGGVTVGTFSDPIGFTLQNNGGADLQLGSLALGGDHPGDFLRTDDSCSGQLLAPGQTCTFSVTFGPGNQSLGARAAEVRVPSNAPTAPDAVPVTGEGRPAPPAIDVSPDRLVAELPEGSRLTAPLLVANRGTLDLVWSTFPAAGSEALTLRPVAQSTAVPPAPIDLDRVDLARLTTGDRTAAATAASPPVTAASPQVTAPGTVTVSHSRSEQVRPANTARCTHTDSPTTNANQFLRTFTLPDFALRTDLELTEVAFGIEDLTTPVDITVNIYLLVGEFRYANLRRLATEQVSLQPQSQTIVTVPISAVAPAGATLVMEIAAPDLHNLGRFTAGSNPSGESAPSYLAASGCGITEPTAYSLLDFPGTHLVMTMTGRVECGASWLAADPGGGVVPGGGSQLVPVTLDAAGLTPGGHATNLCLTSNDPHRPLATVPVTLEVTEREPVTFVGLRDRVMEFEAGGQVTAAGAKRLLATLRLAEHQHDRGSDHQAIRTLQKFQQLAGDSKLVPGEAARDALVADAEQLIQQLRAPLGDPGATAPVAGQHAPT